MLELTGKVRLQKLVYPAGLHYVAENHALRTTVINPIFSAITSISKNLTTNNVIEKYAKDETLSQLYLGFPSSNFFWENLEKTGNELEWLNQLPGVIQYPVVSFSGMNPVFSAMTISQVIDVWHQNEVQMPVLSQSSGTTDLRLYR